MAKRSCLTGTKPYLHQAELRRERLTAEDRRQIKRLMAFKYTRKEAERLTRKQRERRLRELESPPKNAKPKKSGSRVRRPTWEQIIKLRDLGVPAFVIDRITSHEKAGLEIKKHEPLAASADQIAELEELGVMVQSAISRGDAAKLLSQNRKEAKSRKRGRQSDFA